MLHVITSRDDAGTQQQQAGSSGSGVRSIDHDPPITARAATRRANGERAIGNVGRVDDDGHGGRGDGMAE
eukprot:scaffold244950_cov30-Tisochrysis_lutea.AAC.1